MSSAPAVHPQNTDTFWTRFFARTEIGLPEEILPRVYPLIVQRALRDSDGEGSLRVLEVGAGHGTLSAQLADDRRVAAVHATDFCSGAMDLLRKAVANSPSLAAKVTVDQMSASDLKLESSSFDVLVSSMTYMFVLDLDKALVELERVLKPGGRAILTTWTKQFPLSFLFDVFAEVNKSTGTSSYPADYSSLPAVSLADGPKFVERIGRVAPGLSASHECVEINWRGGVDHFYELTLSAAKWVGLKDEHASDFRKHFDAVIRSTSNAETNELKYTVFANFFTIEKKA